MNDRIFEVVVTSVDAAGAPHLAPMGVRYREAQVVLMPFKPSTTLSNVLETRHAVLNAVTDVRVFAGAVTGRRGWAYTGTESGQGVRLAEAAAHVELRLASHQDDVQRPVLRMDRIAERTHTPFIGFNRAQAAVIEAAVLVSRLRMLPLAQVEDEMERLQSMIDKTAGEPEREAWGWLQQAVATAAGGAR